MPRRGKKGGRRGGRKHKSGSKVHLKDVYEADDDAATRLDDSSRFDAEAFPDDDGGEAFEDEEIDEDEAFNSEDERKYGDLLPDYMKGRKGAAAGDEDEEEEEESDEDDGDGMLLSDILAQNLAKEASSQASKAAASAAAASAALRAPRGNSDSDSDSDVDSVLAPSSDDEEDEAETGDAAAEQLMSVVSGLGREGKRSKRTPAPRIVEASEPLQEAEYNLAPDEGGLTLESLVGSLRDSSQFGALKKQLGVLDKGAAPLQKPASKAVQKRAQRQVQYQLTTKEVTKWQALVQANRRAPHLAFDHEQPHAPKSSIATLTSKFKPTTSLEKQVAKILNRGGLATGKELRATETDELEVNELTQEEIKKRKGQLAKLKALMFYDELKRRHANKIKSKAYRRKRKRQAKRKEAKEREELRRLDPEAAAKLDEEEAMQIARARVTLKHRNRSKWAKWALKHGGTDNEHRRDALNAMAAKPEELRRKMARVAGARADTSSDEEGADGNNASKYLTRAKALLKDTEGSDEEDGGGQGGVKVKGLAGMKFMQDVAKRRRLQARAEARALVDELERLADNEDGSDGTAQSKAKDSKTKAAAPTGRMSFTGATVGGKKKRGGDEDGVGEAREADAAMRQALRAGSTRSGLQLSQVRSSAGDALAVAMDGAIDVEGVASTPHGAQESGTADSEDDDDSDSSDGSDKDEPEQDNGNEEDDDEANPWMRRGSQRTKKASSKRKSKRRGRPSDDVLPVASVLKAIAGTAADKQGGASDKQGDSKQGEEQGEEWGQVVDGEWQSKKDDKSSKKSAKTPGALEQAEAAKAASRRKKEQLELVRRAFAGVGADEEFAAEKAAAEEAEQPKTEKVLAGWGSWTGHGPLPKERKTKRQRKKEALEAKKKKEAEEAAKAKLKRKRPKFHAARHVLVNDKRDKKAVKYLAATVPYPFKTREQYERSLRNPIGRDWNTALATEALNRPEITSKLGQHIQPIAYAKPQKRGGRAETSITASDPLHISSSVPGFRKTNDSTNKSSKKSKQRRSSSTRNKRPTKKRRS